MLDQMLVLNAAIGNAAATLNACFKCRHWECCCYVRFIIMKNARLNAVARLNPLPWEMLD